MVAAAVIGAGALAAGATVVGADSAASATQSATNASIAQQQAALQQQATLSAPYRNLGQSAISQYQSLLGISPQTGTGQPTGPGGATGMNGTFGPSKTIPAASIEQTLASTPGYQFQKQQGLDATKASAASMGLGLSGNTLQALDTYSTGLADSTYQQAVGNSLNAVQLGQAAAAGQAANIGNAANNISGSLINQGNTNAGIYANEAAGVARSAGNAANQYATYNTLQNLQTPASPYVSPTLSTPQTPTLAGGQYNDAWS